MSKSENIPSPAVKRLSLYLRQLEAFEANDRLTISSKELGTALNLSDAKVRKDLAYFGQFGHPGVGYRVPDLIARVRRILGTDKLSNVLLVGVGNLGRALLQFRGFAKRGFEIAAAFDNDEKKMGALVDGPHPLHIQPIHEMAAVARRLGIRVGILTVPASAAQTVADELVGAGIRAVLNFAPVRIRVPKEVAVSSVDLGVHLEQLSFQLNGGK